jgi:hypothetical protein
MHFSSVLMYKISISMIIHKYLYKFIEISLHKNHIFILHHFFKTFYRQKMKLLFVLLSYYLDATHKT